MIIYGTMSPRAVLVSAHVCVCACVIYCHVTLHSITSAFVFTMLMSALDTNLRLVHQDSINARGATYHGWTNNRDLWFKTPHFFRLHHFILAMAFLRFIRK